MRELCANLAQVAPRSRIFNYANPVNIVSQVVADNTGIPIVSFCEGAALDALAEGGVTITPR